MISFLPPSSSVTPHSLVGNICVMMQSFLGASFPERGRQIGKGSKKSNKMIIGLGDWTYGER